MEKQRVLIVTQELNPYVGISDIADMIEGLPLHIQNGGMEIRILMPCFGNINERRHRLHEVVRLSGINIIIDKDDYPLIIKVASLPGARIQVYFLDNDDLFNGKDVFYNSKNQFYEDNAERMIFFCKGVLETVKKFGWAPDIIHCHGWMTSLIPLYVKTVYKNEPIFEQSKVIYSVYENPFKESLGPHFVAKAPINNALEPKDLKYFEEANFDGINLGAIEHADGIVQASKKLNSKISKSMKAQNGKPTLNYLNGDKSLEACMDFYNKLLA